MNSSAYQVAAYATEKVFQGELKEAEGMLLRDQIFFYVVFWREVRTWFRFLTFL